MMNLTDVEALQVLFRNKIGVCIGFDAEVLNCYDDGDDDDVCLIFDG